MISTDKAVEPVSAMGATKRLAELLTVASARRTGRPFVAVRFGNVLGSSGSVIPVFERQLEQGKPITITHADATRYFMTIPEAVSLILEAGATTDSGVVFVLDMASRSGSSTWPATSSACPVSRRSRFDRVHRTSRRRAVARVVVPRPRNDRADHPRVDHASPASAVGSVGEPLLELLAELEPAAWNRDDDKVRELLRKVSAISKPSVVAPARTPRKTRAAAPAAPEASPEGSR